jgi:hypothetical protein
VVAGSGTSFTLRGGTDNDTLGTALGSIGTLNGGTGNDVCVPQGNPSTSSETIQ